MNPRDMSWFLQKEEIFSVRQASLKSIGEASNPSSTNRYCFSLKIIIIRKTKLWNFKKTKHYQESSKLEKVVYKRFKIKCVNITGEQFEPIMPDFMEGLWDEIIQEVKLLKIHVIDRQYHDDLRRKVMCRKHLGYPRDSSHSWRALFACLFHYP